MKEVRKLSMKIDTLEQRPGQIDLDIKDEYNDTLFYEECTLGVKSTSPEISSFHKEIKKKLRKRKKRQ